VTPYQRVLASEHVPESQKAVLETLHSALNPLELRKQERVLHGQIDKAIKAANAGCLTEGLVEVPNTPEYFLRYTATSLRKVGKWAGKQDLVSVLPTETVENRIFFASRHDSMFPSDICLQCLDPPKPALFSQRLPIIDEGPRASQGG